MIARLIENWLANTTERGGYEIPFCQALTANGHSILFRSGHGSHEQGKDIITTDRTGCHHAYQLKAGDLTLPAWRTIKHEVEELVRLPIEHPNVPAATQFEPHLVISGLLKDPTRTQIKKWNEEWKRLGRGPLEVVDRNALIRLFVDTQAEVLPTQPADLERFLRLYLSDRRDILDHSAFAEFLESVLPLDCQIKRSVLKRVCSGVALLASYVLLGFHRAGNHLAEAEGWLFVTAYLLAMLEPLARYERVCRQSIELCVSAYRQASDALIDEALSRQYWIEGDGVTDYAVRGWRTTTLVGHASAVCLRDRIQGGRHPREHDIVDRITRELRNSFFWGEGAGPYYLFAMLLLWLRGQEALACAGARELVQVLSSANSAAWGLGVPDPYVDVQLLLRDQHLRKTQFKAGQTFRGRSFLLRSLVEFLARRGRKQTLRFLWYDISEVDHAEFKLDSPVDFYRWRAKTGSLHTRRWKHPQEWSELVTTAKLKQSKSDLLIASLYPHLLPSFFLLYPHRMTPAMARLIEQLVA